VQSELDGLETKNIYSPVKINSMFYLFFYYLTKFVTIFNKEGTFYHFHNAQMSSAFLSKRNKKNTILTVHGFPAFDIFNNNPKGIVRNIHLKFVKRIVNGDFLVTSVDELGISRLEKCFGVNIKNKFIIPNCTQSNNLLSEGVQSRCRKFVFVGALDENKGIELLAKAFSDIGSDIELHIFGTGDLYSALLRIYRSHQRIFFYGSVQRSEIIKLLPRFDVYVSLSRHEGFSMSFIEALASGLAVLTTDWGDVVRYINGNGFVIKRELTDIKKSLIQFSRMDDIDLELMKGVSKEIYQSTLSPEIITERYQKLYHDNA
jgi:glycosyltransferase involved in cell wall biosynthesis